MREDHQADGDPAQTARRQFAEPAGRDRQADRRAGQPGQHAADEDIEVTQAIDVDAQRIGRGWILTHRAQMQAGPRAIDVVPGDRNEQITDVHQHVLIREQDRADDGNLRQTGNVMTGSSAMVPALLNPSPSTRLMPVPRNVNARPLTT